MRAQLRDETNPAVLPWIVSTLGYHHGSEVLSQVLPLADHPDERVRFHVAAALASLVDLDHVESEAADALIRLCHDGDDETRLYALYAATREIAGLDVQAVSELAAQLANDPDEQVRAMAIAHHEAVHEVRELLTEAFGPSNTTGAYDHPIGPVLVTLDWAGAAGEARQWLEDEIRRHLGTAADPFDTSGIAGRLVRRRRDLKALRVDGRSSGRSGG